MTQWPRGSQEFVRITSNDGVEAGPKRHGEKVARLMRGGRPQWPSGGEMYG